MPRGRQASSQDSDVFPDIPKIDRQESETTDDAMVQTYVRTEGPSDGGSARLGVLSDSRRGRLGDPANSAQRNSPQRPQLGEPVRISTLTFWSPMKYSELMPQTPYCGDDHVSYDGGGGTLLCVARDS